MGSTVHLIDSEFNIQKCVLDIQALSENHSAESLYQKFLGCKRAEDRQYDSFGFCIAEKTSRKGTTILPVLCICSDDPQKRNFSVCLFLNKYL